MANNITLSPVDEDSFDVEAIEKYLAYRNDVMLDPAGTDTYIVCGVPEAKKDLRNRRLADPSRFPYAVLITVGFSKVQVAQEYGDEAKLRSARDFVRWMVEHFRCEIEDTYGTDWTERVAKEGVNVLYPKQID